MPHTVSGAPAVVALCGGTGGAKLVDGLHRDLPPGKLAVIVNTADDFDHFGLHVSPDVDTVLYTIAGIADPRTGWGVAGDTDRAMQALASLGAETWFHLGDRDLATHLARTAGLAQRRSLTEVTRTIGAALGVERPVLPMADDPVRTIVRTAEGERDFQPWFVRDRCRPPALGVRYAGVESARPSPEALRAIAAAERIVLCPSNPFLSIGPILALPGMRRALVDARAPVVAVSPVIGGRAVKGPSAAMLRDIVGHASALAVARLYADFVNGWLLDVVDAGLVEGVAALGCTVDVTDTLMRTVDDRCRVARAVLDLADGIAGRQL